MSDTHPGGARSLGELLLAISLAALTWGIAGALISGSSAWGSWIAGVAYHMFVTPWWAVWLGFSSPGYFFIVVMAALVTAFVAAGFQIRKPATRLAYLVVLLLAYSGAVIFAMSLLPPLVA